MRAEEEKEQQTSFPRGSPPEEEARSNWIKANQESFKKQTFNMDEELNSRALHRQRVEDDVESNAWCN